VPAPLFLILGTVSWITASHSVCGPSTWIIPEMVLMWYLMALAHLTPWLLWWQQRDLARH
jgi:hypothetical protein